ncbi:MAG: DUF3050 domain-containing protein [Limisphaerales bacterium]|jgi:hypothetical protein
MDLTVIKPLQDRLEEHPVYAKVKDLDRLRVFMQYHVYSVWDFMSLLKALQRELAPAQTPWLPGRFSSAQRFINEIVLEEESDEAPPMAGAVRYLSHFEMYVESMKDVAADTVGINHFLDRVRLDGVDMALKTDIAPAAANDFMRTTFEIVGEGKLHEVAAAFALGREHVIPRMFRSLLAEMNISAELAPTFHYYLSRHVDLDELEHGPMAMRMLDVLCEGHPFREAEALVAAQKALEARLKFWDSVELAL